MQQELQESPYRGMQSFSEYHKDLFFGRTKPTEDIFVLLKNNLLTLVFGKSGVGKTSLLNAGLVPKLRANFFLPILIRIPFADKQVDPLAYVRTCIENEIRKYIRKDFTYPSNTTLWQFFREVNSTKGAITPVLIFDQFEEYFRFGKRNALATAFIDELADLIENRVPDSLSEEARKIIKTDNSQNIFRVVISLREDFLAPLEELSRKIPSINKVHYRILQLHGQEAFDAVYLPAKHLIDEKTVMTLLEKIIPPKIGSSDSEQNGDTLKKDWRENDFESYILSLFCYQVNEKRITVKQDKISENLIRQTKVETILDDYYRTSLGKYRRKYRRNFGPVLEQNLISNEGYRLLKPVSAKEFKVFSEQAINDLVDDRIIQRENRNDLSYIEISHDLVAKVIYDRKIDRQRKKRYYQIFGIVVAALVVVFMLIYAVQEHFNYQALKQKDNLVTQTQNQITDLVNSVTGDTSYNSQSSQIKDTIYFMVNDFNGVPQARLCIAALKRLNFGFYEKSGVPHMEIRKDFFDNSVRYFNKNDEANAVLIKNICDKYYSAPLNLQSMVNSTYAGDKPLEVWVLYDPYYLQLFSPIASVRDSAEEFMIKNYKTADSLKQWPHKLIMTAYSKPRNKSGIYNILAVFNNMDRSYLFNSQKDILLWLDSIERNADPKTVQLIRSVRSKLNQPLQVRPKIF